MQTTEDFVAANNVTFEERKTTTAYLSFDTRFKITLEVAEGQDILPLLCRRISDSEDASTDLADFESTAFAKSVVGALANRMSAFDWAKLKNEIDQEMKIHHGVGRMQVVKQFAGGQYEIYEVLDTQAPSDAPKSEKYAWFLRIAGTKAVSILGVESVVGSLRKFKCGSTLDILSDSSAVLTCENGKVTNVFKSTKEQSYFFK